MTLRYVTVSTPGRHVGAILDAAETCKALRPVVHAEAQDEDRATVTMVAAPEKQQDLLDALQQVLGDSGEWQITLLPVETVLPFPEEEEAEDGEDEEPPKVGGRTREEILSDVNTKSAINRDYLVFVILSSIVAAFGMIADNVAVVIGAMVIAPLLGPVLAFSVGVALGDGRLMLRAAGAALMGSALAFGIGAAIGALLASDPTAAELVARTDVGFDGIAIGLASGAAAALSLVTGLSSALVGVMVAVALLPPATASGVFLGAGDPESAAGAILLLAVNIVCVNLAAQAVMFTRGITPRSWFEKKRARRGSIINAALWLGLLAALAVLLFFRTPTIP